MNITLHNFMTGNGFTGGAYSQEWYMAWIMLAVLVVIGILAKKWLGEEQLIGYEYNALFGFIGSLLSYFVFVTLTGWWKIGFIVGVVGMLIGGILLGQYGSGN